MGKKKRQHRKTGWIGKIQPAQDIWLEEDDELLKQFSFVHKLHPEQPIDDTLQSLVEQGFLSIRTNERGKREYRLNRKVIDAALAKLPPEKRTGREIKVYEDIAMICGYDNKMTTMLSVVIQQTDALRETEVVPWIVKTREQLMADTFGTCDPIQESLAKLEARNFIEMTEGNPTQYRYRLNVAVVQAALDALPEREEEGK